MTHQASERMLRLALIANASFSALSAALCLSASQAIGKFMGVPTGEIFSLGVELGLFALGIGFLLSRDLTAPWARRVVGAIIALDVLWVIASLALLALPTPLTVAGKWTLGIVALAVADFAFFQWRGLRGMSRKAATRPGPVTPLADPA